MSRLTRLEVSNFKGIVAVDIPISGVTEISGRNGAGKSSALDSIAVFIDGLVLGKTELIRKGQERATIRGRLGEMHVTRHIEHKKDGGHTTKIIFEPVEGKPFAATQKQLDDLIGEHRLDPLDFLKLDSKQRFTALQAFVPGIDFAKSAQADAGDMLRRKDVNRLAKESRAVASMIVVPDGTPDEPVDERALVDQLAQAGVHNADIETRRGNRVRAAEEVARKRAAAEASLALIPEALAKVQGQNDKLAAGLNTRIADLEAQLVDLREQLANVATLGTKTAENEEARLRAESAEHTAEADKLQGRIDAAEALPKAVDIADLRAQIDAAKVANAGVARAAERTKHTAIADRYEAEAMELTEAMDARRAAREAAIAAAAMPVKGLEFGDGEILLHGVPFEQASTAQKLKAAFEYCIGCNPVLRLAWLRDASLLDDEMFAEVGRLAVELDCDVLLETVRPIGNNSVVLEAGRVKAVHQESEQESAA